MQIKALALYNAQGQRRDVAFRTGELNIITGATKTGKTAIIGIIDYCLGRNDYVVPAGRIRDLVTWYALHVTLGSNEAIICRPAPQGSTTSDAYLEVGASLSMPEYDKLTRTIGSEQLVSYLGEHLGISENEHVPGEGQTRRSLQVNLKHARFLLFQPQYRIMAPDLMFYRQQEDFVAQAIRDSLPYLLGATRDDQYRKVQELRLAKRELKIAERRLDDEEALRGRDATRALALVEQAQNVGLLDRGANTYEVAVELLRSVVNWNPSHEESPPSNRLEFLREERESLLEGFKVVQAEIDAANAFSLAQDDYTKEMAYQTERLAAAGLYQTNPTRNTCPLCETDLAATVPVAAAINKSFEELRRNIGTAYAQRPRLVEFVSDKQSQLSELRMRLTANKGAIEALVEQDEALRRERNRVAEQARVVGRAGLFLESITTVLSDSRLRESIATLEAKVQALEEELSDDKVEDRIDSILRRISGWMTEWAGILDFEHKEWPLGFDLKHLTAVSYREDRPERMSEIGGGSNWLICHLVTHLALQRWFISKKRPVPSFVVFDQPSQAYFPREKPFEGTVEDLGDQERNGVRRIFRFMYDVVRELTPNLQVIVTDHADLAEDWFEDSVVENWHEGTALVPAEWYE